MARLVLTALCLAALAGCAGTPERGELRQYACTDGTSFAAEVSDNLLVILTPTGTVDLPLDRDTDARRYTNRIRTVILDGEQARYSVGGTWRDCTRMRIAPLQSALDS